MLAHRKAAATRLSKGRERRSTAYSTANARKAPEDSPLTDWDAQLSRTLAPSTMKDYNWVIKQYEEFVGEEFHQSPDEAKEYTQKYFRRGGPLPSLAEVRRFIKYIAQSHNGNDGGKLRLTSARNYLLNLLGALKHYNTKYDRETAQQLWLYLNDVVAPQFLSWEVNEKAVAYPHDRPAILAALWRPHVLISFPDMRRMLQATLVVNLCIDLCGRIGELLIDKRSYEEDGTTERLSDYHGRLLTWGRVRFELHRRSSDAPLRLTAHVKVCGMKGQKRTPGAFKELSLKAKPASKALQDPARLLLYHAILGDHLEQRLDGLDCLQRANPGPHGVSLPVKKASLDAFVFTKSEDDPSPLGQKWIGDQMQVITKELGLRLPLTTRSFRYGIAQKLNSGTDTDTRKQLMGHCENSRVFSHYQAKLAQVDVQAILADEEQEDVLNFSSIMNRAVADAPKVLSTAGYARVTALPDYRAASDAVKSAAAAVRVEYKTLRAAKVAKADIYKAYERAHLDWRSVHYKLVKDAYRLERQEHLAAHDPGVLRQSFLTSEGPATIADPVQAPSLPSASRLDDAHEDLLSEAEEEEGNWEEEQEEWEGFGSDEEQQQQQQQQQQDETAMDWLSLDWFLAQTGIGLDEEIVQTSSGMDMADATPDGEEVDQVGQERLKEDEILDDEAYDAYGEYDVLDAETTYDVHDSDIAGDVADGAAAGAANDADGRADAAEESSGMPRESGLRQHAILTDAQIKATRCPRPNLSSGVFERITAGELTDLETDRLLLPLFRVKHPLDRFPTNMAPVPGTYACRHCGADLAEFNSPYKHVKDCALLAAQATVAPPQAQLDFVRQPCEFMKGRRSRSKPQGRQCAKTFDNVDAWRAHVRKEHVENDEFCRAALGSCNDALDAGPKCTYYPAHLLDDHGINTFAPGEPLTWCCYCEDWLPLPMSSKALGSHFGTHVPEAMANIREVGYTGYSLNFRLLIPGSCIFCVHDATLPARKRVDFPDAQNLNAHVGAHVYRISTPVHCPASSAGGADGAVCASQELYDATEMRTHLRVDHGIDLTDRQFIRQERLKKGKADKRALAKAKQGDVHMDEAQAEALDERQSPSVTAGVLEERCPNTPSKRRKYK